MRILAIFVDMLGAEYLHSCNLNMKDTPMDDLMEKLGGTIYCNCYTPAPDTPRSSACMWSGVYPKKNGCDSRLKYPGFFGDSETDLWSELDKNGYDLNLFIRENQKQIGLIPLKYAERAFSGTIDEFVNQVKITENSFTFFYLPDLHTILDLESYSTKGLEKGTNFVTSLIKKILDGFSEIDFDYLMFFSDHGFRKNGEQKSHIIHSDRVKTMMYVKKKEDDILKKDYKLRSNLDVYPTICEMANIEVCYSVDGISLLSDKGHEYLLIEDHNDFNAKICQTIEHWAVVDANGFHWLEYSGEWEHQSMTEFDEEEFEKIIVEKASNYKENRDFYRTYHIYSNNLIRNEFYSDGSRIVKKKVTKITKFVSLMKWFLSRMKYHLVDEKRMI